MGHLLGHASTNYAPARTSLGGSGLPYFNQRGRVLEMSLFLESQFNGAITNDKCKYLNSGGQISCPPNHLQWHNI